MPIDAALETTPAWTALADHAAAIERVDLAALFAADPARLETFAHDLEGVRYDFAKLAASAATLTALGALAATSRFYGWRAELFAGAVVNPSEGRAATHIAERGSGAAADIAAAAVGQARLRAVAEAVRRDGTRHVIHIGIGGSALGPALLLDALGNAGAKGDHGPAVHVVANIDGVALERALAACDPGVTRIVTVSKTFTTLETMTNAQSALDWLAAHGVAASKIGINVVAPDAAFLVKHWRYVTPPPTSPTALTHRLVMPAPATPAPGTVIHSAGMGVPGQGNPNPPPAFENHFIIKYGGRYYDPSYGAGPVADQHAWEAASIDGVLRHVAPPPPPPPPPPPALPPPPPPPPPNTGFVGSPTNLLTFTVL